MSCPNNDFTKLNTRHEDKCKENCSFNYKYNPNGSCKLTNKGDYLEIKTDGTNTVTYNSQPISLDNVRLYVPSLHTFDGKHVDAELILKHSGGSKNIMVSLPIKVGKGVGHSVTFFKQFASHIPLEKNTPTTVNVNTWSLNDVMPSPKTPFYNYNGDAPYPPCNVKATMIVFDPTYASIINQSELDLIKKTIKPAEKNASSSTKEGFVGRIGGFREGMVTYNSGGANNTEEDDTSQAMECTEYYDSDPSSSGGDSESKSIKKPSIDWSKILSSPAFIWIIVILAIIGGGILFYYVLWPLLKSRLDGVRAAPELEIP
jgi:carbonic anhydrase